MKNKAYLMLSVLSTLLFHSEAEDVSMTAESAVVITFPSQSHKTYKLLAAASAGGQWATLQDGIVGTGGTVTIFYKSQSDQKLFFKVQTSDGPVGQQSLLSLAHLDISHQDLTGYNFEGADLRGYDFMGSNFNGDDLMAAELSGANCLLATFVGARPESFGC